jgi:hypothetical protein
MNNPRTLIVGDVHGCPDELEALLAKARVVQGLDRVVLVGDVMVRGPDSRRALAIARELGASVVRGNHEHRLLAGRAGTARLGPDHEHVAKDLTAEEWRVLEAMPLWLDLPEHDVRVVHAGVVPGRDMKDTPQDALLRMRTMDAEGGWSDRPNAGELWGTRYVGPPHVVFGHNARAEPQLHAWATGIDTGCVYGGNLTAVVLDAGEPMPRGEAARARLVSVPARRRYFWGSG